MWSYPLGLTKKEIGSLRLSTCKSAESTPNNAANFLQDLQRPTRSFLVFFANTLLYPPLRTRLGTYAPWWSLVQIVPSGIGEHTSYRSSSITLTSRLLIASNEVVQCPTRALVIISPRPPKRPSRTHSILRSVTFCLQTSASHNSV